jgi:hypothetical protein
MSPEEEWEYEQKLDYFYYRLEELVLGVFINVMEKLNDRNESFVEPQKKSLKEEMKF